jgi:hypothetical protein
MYVDVAVMTHNQRFALHRNHPDHPCGFLFPSFPTPLKIRQLADVMDIHAVA